MEEKLAAVAADPLRADVLSKARAFKRTWLELAQALSQCQAAQSWQAWGFADFDQYCRNELHLRQATVAKLLGSYRFLESSAPRVIERARASDDAPIPSLASVDFVRKATDHGIASEATMGELRRVAFEDGAEPALLRKTFGPVAFPTEETKEAHSKQLAAAARRLASLVADANDLVPKGLAMRVEETIGELLEAIEPN